jgi:predicted AlkP superfamily pyrophosphatase or phosphodiesterase
MSRLTCLTLVAVYLLAPPALRAADPQPLSQHVVLISVDGLAASYLSDPRAKLPTLHQLAKEGAVAEGMTTTFPSVTWPSHTSLITGVTAAKHGVIGNSVFLRDAQKNLTYIGDPELTKDQSIRVPTIYDVLAGKGLKTAAIIWPCSNGAKNLPWSIPDSNKGELHEKYTTPGLQEELAEAGIDILPLREWGWNKDRSLARDELYSKVARYLLVKHRPSLTLLHFITPDGVEHAYSPHTPEAYKAVDDTDARVREVWETLQQGELKGKSTLLVVSDHGFAPYEKLLQPNAVLKQLGLIETDDTGKVTRRDAWCLAQGGSSFVYVLNKERKAEIVAQLRKALGSTEGVTDVLGPEEFMKLGLPDPAQNPEMADLVLTTGPGYSFSDKVADEAIADAGGLKGSHGHRVEPDYMHATFIAAGAGIRPGTKLGVIRNVDVAPTIARLLGVTLPEVDGKVPAGLLSE